MIGVGSGRRCGRGGIFLAAIILRFTFTVASVARLHCQNWEGFVLFLAFSIVVLPF